MYLRGQSLFRQMPRKHVCPILFLSDFRPLPSLSPKLGIRRREGRSARAEAKPFTSSIRVRFSVRILILPSASQPLRLAYTHFIPQAYLGPPSDPGWEPVLDKATMMGKERRGIDAERSFEECTGVQQCRRENRSRFATRGGPIWAAQASETERIAAQSQETTRALRKSKNMVIRPYGEERQHTQRDGHRISKMFSVWRVWQSGAGVAVWDVAVPWIG
ncbi:hypothetical protein DFH08DRAFT_805972 [Mycena albidolilacea]|uniref:Uncharacterized protein n=1 Tax=Mycena albidolilacea TaxID=1033008 RepID=A0AAD7A7A5_9AGAR|nr:hypothetical protein DFH08DRAFT_805972 [Mycena albidolilacea]